jgi:hypothetical protein
MVQGKKFIPDEQRQRDATIAAAAKKLRERIKKARKDAQELQQQDHRRTGVARSKLQLLGRFRQQLSPFAAMLAIVQEEKDLLHRSKQGLPNGQLNQIMDDLAFVRQQKELLLQDHPNLPEQTKGIPEFTVNGF